MLWFFLCLGVDSCMELLYERLERKGEDGKSWGCFLAPQAFEFLLLVQKV